MQILQPANISELWILQQGKSETRYHNYLFRNQISEYFIGYRNRLVYSTKRDVLYRKSIISQNIYLNFLLIKMDSSAYLGELKWQNFHGRKQKRSGVPSQIYSL